ncbi:2461_t:CDS:2, partial [Paraglomus occultum]
NNSGFYYNPRQQIYTFGGPLPLTEYTYNKEDVESVIAVARLLVLDLKDGSTGINTQIVQYAERNADYNSQLWIFEGVDQTPLNTISGGRIKNKKSIYMLVSKAPVESVSKLIQVAKENATL